MYVQCSYSIVKVLFVALTYLLVMGFVGKSAAATLIIDDFTDGEFSLWAGSGSSLRLDDVVMGNVGTGSRTVTYSGSDRDFSTVGGGEFYLGLSGPWTLAYGFDQNVNLHGSGIAVLVIDVDSAFNRAVAYGLTLTSSRVTWNAVGQVEFPDHVRARVTFPLASLPAEIADSVDGMRFSFDYSKGANEVGIHVQSIYGVPEPSGAAMTVFGGIALCSRRSRSQQCKTRRRS